jgi:hypothetical protein
MWEKIIAEAEASLGRSLTPHEAQRMWELVRWGEPDAWPLALLEIDMEKGA